MNDEYRETASPAEKARDFIAGMTDEYFYHTAEDMLLPKYHSDLS
jgi:dGTP triphosphohydrolase